MVLDPAGIMMICIPIFLPVVVAHGFDPVWFGILFIINMEIGYMTPLRVQPVLHEGGRAALHQYDGHL
jgi:TRAP-type C4-dicarboxylate transport system permease large subunit